MSSDCETSRARCAQARAKIETPEQVMRLRERVRRKLAECYGPLPERTPLNSRTTGSVEREYYSIEKLVYESRPNYLVTGNVYVPKDRTERMPAVLGACGHSANGKAAEPYQEFARNLARQGYVVLIYDPPAQGERLEYPDSEPGPNIRGGTHSHNQAGNQMTLLGKNFALWEAWDGIRGVDYLLSRPDVDPNRIGVTGNSGGGTQTCHLCALDDRFAMAAPNCFVTRFLNNLENEEPTDAEQIVPGMLAAGLDMADFFVAQIPRPVLLGGEVNDFFDVRGLRKTYEELRRLYAILGAKDKVELYVGPGTHGYNRGARENMYGFFNKHAGIDGSAEEPQVPVEPEDVLQVTPGGQVHLLDSRRTYDFTREEASGLAGNRTRLSRGRLSERFVSPCDCRRAARLRVIGSCEPAESGTIPRLPITASSSRPNYERSRCYTQSTGRASLSIDSLAGNVPRSIFRIGRHSRRCCWAKPRMSPARRFASRWTSEVSASSRPGHTRTPATISFTTITATSCTRIMA